MFGGRTSSVPHLALLLLLKAATSLAQAIPDFPVILNTTFPLTLAVQPSCGPLTSQRFTEINTGIISLDKIRTTVAFGDSWTDNGSNGTVPIPPMMWPPVPEAGSAKNPAQTRASNGFVWVEIFANTLSAKLLDYAIGGAVIDNFAYTSTNPNNILGHPQASFVDQASLFFLQGKFLDALVPSQTLYTVAFGINDHNQAAIAGGNWDRAFNSYVAKLGELQAAGARNILIHGMFQSFPDTDRLQDRVFGYLRDSKAQNGTNFAFVNLEKLFTAIKQDPASFGYRGSPTCLRSSVTTVGGCNDPDHSVFWIPGHPSQVTHRLISQYTQAVLKNCTV
ncbi:hypothetical protein K435DRAFT_733845 [Dendrothele bispora CBS 962.96]|uniref:Carbohydrate esterase family 16 protein n=1 Tax=Dendrothele bispora (strain CBS 962.96) TaxID=1314807 RepID=A0A4S8L5E5_DENBC|nr:hypothetical protein K435DRAFT_733845 [Dendrothele bispora CBS 962.96]